MSGITEITLRKCRSRAFGFGCSNPDILVNLSDLVMERSIDLESANLSVLSDISVQPLDCLFSNESILIPNEDELLSLVLKLDSDCLYLLNHIQFEFLSEDGISLLVDHFGIPPELIWDCPIEWITTEFDSLIISDFPKIFTEFRKKQFSFLRRNCCDGFGVSEFHLQCNDQAMTLIVILDTGRNIFGSLTLVEWESREWKRLILEQNKTVKADGSLKSCLFTLKNPHNISVKRFALNDEKKNWTIYCWSQGIPYCQ
jgi:hypothetical protein